MIDCILKSTIYGTQKCSFRSLDEIHYFIALKTYPLSLRSNDGAIAYVSEGSSFNIVREKGKFNWHYLKTSESSIDHSLLVSGFDAVTALLERGVLHHDVVTYPVIRENRVKNLSTAIVMQLQSLAEEFPLRLSLSGGDDSIFLFFVLLNNNIPFECYTYGSWLSWEVIVASRLCKRFEVRLTHFNFPPKTRLIDVYNSFKGSVILPSLPDLLVFLENKDYFEDVLVINGQTGDWLRGQHCPLNDNHIFDDFIKKHFRLIDRENDLSFLKSTLNNLEKKFGKLTQESHWHYEKSLRQERYILPAYSLLPFKVCMPFWSPIIITEFMTMNNFQRNTAYEKAYRMNVDSEFLENIRRKARRWKKLHTLLFFPLRIFGQRYSPTRRYLSSYFLKYKSFYPHRNYLEYLLRNRYVRNPVYWLAKCTRE